VYAWQIWPNFFVYEPWAHLGMVKKLLFTLPLFYFPFYFVKSQLRCHHCCYNCLSWTWIVNFSKSLSHEHETPHQLHTHYYDWGTISSSYSYGSRSNKDATPSWYMLGPQSQVASVGESLGFSLISCCRLWLGHLTHFIRFILIAGLLHTYIMCVSTCYCGYRL